MEKEFFELLKEFFKVSEMHQEISFNNETCVIDKKDNTITITLEENKDKKEFEEWLKNVKDDLFSEVLEELGEAFDLNRQYNSENYKEVIDKVKSKTKEIASRKIKELQSLID